MKLFAVLALCSSTALAQEAKPLVNKTGFQLRAESTSTTSQDGDAPARNAQSFNIKTARMVMSGDVTESASYTLRLDVKNALFEKSTVGADTSIAALDRAYIEQRLGEGLTVRIGRLPITALSIENDYSSMDRYYESLIDYVLTYQILTITTGASVSYSVAGQTFSFDIFNGFNDTTTGFALARQKGENLSLALAWRGNLAGGMVKPLISYNRISRVRNGDEGSTERDEKATFAAFGIGTQVSVAGADIDLEFDQLTKPKFKYFTHKDKTDSTPAANTEVTSLESKLSSIITQVAYNVPSLRLRPLVKYSQETEKTDGKDSRKYKRGNIGVEFRPSSRPLRYHAVVVSKNDEDISATKTVTKKSTQYIVGVAAKI